MSNAPLMPKATAVWLVDNTALTFDQVADFTKMHPLEVRAIADGDAAQGIKGMDPISTGQLSRDEIERGEKDPITDSSSARARWRCRRPPRRRAHAIPRCRAATSGRARSSGWSATTPN